MSDCPPHRNVAIDRDQWRLNDRGEYCWRMQCLSCGVKGWIRRTRPDETPDFTQSEKGGYTYTRSTGESDGRVDPAG